MTKETNSAQSVPTPPPVADDAAAPVPLTTEELDQLKSKAALADEHWDKFLRASADLDNYRKRVARERDELARASKEQIILALLPALDNLERALDHSPEGTPLHDGLLQVQTQFKRALADFGLVELTAAPGDMFDSKIHDAVSHIESAERDDGAVIEQHQSGYKFADRLLRPIRVTVSKGDLGS